MTRKKKRKVKLNSTVVNQKPVTAKQGPEVEKTTLFDKTDALTGCGIFLGTLIVYIFTLAPTVYFGDSGELTAAAYNLGIAHPPGYPLYLLLGKLFMLLVPFGDAAMRMNLMSALFASLTAVTIYLINRVLNHGRLISILVSLIAAFSFTFWSQAVVAEVYTLYALFFCAMIFLTLLWLKDKKEHRILLLALTAGLAMTHHVIIALYFPVFLIFILLDQPRLLKNWKLIVKVAALFLLPLLLYLYLPIRSASNPLNDWGNPETFSAMVDHIAARQFGGMFLKHGFDGVLFQLRHLTGALLNQFPFILLILAAAGMAAGWKRERKTTLFFLVLLAVNLSYSSTYYITDIEPHFIHIFLILALFTGNVFDYIYRWAQRVKNLRVRWAAAAISAIIALLPLGFNWAECDQSGNYLARDYGRNMIDSMDKNGVLFIDGEAELFIVAYLKIVENMRPDVEVYDARQNIFYIPAMKEKKKRKVTPADLYKFVQTMVTDKRPVYFVNPIFGNLKVAEYGVLYKVLQGNESPGGITDPWEKYRRRGLDNTYSEPNAKETQGKYFFKRAAYLWKTNRRALSGEFLEKAIAAGGDRHLVLKFAAVFCMETDRRDKAETLLKKAVRSNPFDSDDYNMLAMIAHYRSDYTGAMENYDKAIALQGDSISVLMNRGMLYEQLGDRASDGKVKKGYYRKAYDDVERSVRLEPSNPGIRRIKSRIFQKLNQM